MTHGDIFDTVTTHMRWLAMLGDVGYTFLLWLNKVYNHRRERQGKPYFSLSQEVKHRVKSAVSYISELRRAGTLSGGQAFGWDYLRPYSSSGERMVW